MQQPSDEVLSRVTFTLSWSRQLIAESRELCKQAEHKVASARQAIQESRRNREPAPTRSAFYPGALSR